MTQDELPSSDPPPPLNYQAAGEETRQARPWAQAAVGFLAALVVCAAINLAGGFLILDSRQPWEALATIGVCLAGLALFAWFGWRLRRRGRWPAFLPGALLGWGIAAAIEGVCYVSLANMTH